MKDLLSNFKLYKAPRKNVLEQYQSEVEFDKASGKVIAYEDQLSTLEDAVFERFDDVNFSVYLESLYESPDDYVCYLAVASNGKVLGESNYTLEAKLEDVFATITENIGGPYRVEEMTQGRNYVTFYVGNSDYDDKVFVSGILDPELFELIDEAKNEDAAYTIATLIANTQAGHNVVNESWKKIDLPDGMTCFYPRQVCEDMLEGTSYGPKEAPGAIKENEISYMVFLFDRKMESLHEKRDKERNCYIFNEDKRLEANDFMWDIIEDFIENIEEFRNWNVSKKSWNTGGKLR